MADCLFCKIVAKQIPAKILHEDADTLAFADIDPQAPEHLLVIPKKHIATLNDAAPEDEQLLGRLFRTAAKLAKERGFADRGWRAVVNVNKDAHQLVFHVHLHVLAGRAFRWPPG
jgi:histidine triad (HIT) family protein